MNNNKCRNLGRIFTFFGVFVVFFLGATSVYGAKGFIVEKSGGSKILITDGYSEYIIEHNYDCYDSEFIEGATIYIDSYISPMYGDTIIISGGFSKSTCEVTSSNEVNIKRYYVDKVLDSDDKIIVTDKNSVQYLVEYGLGCGLSMWRYEGKTVDIDIGGSFLDGIGDRMYLFDSGRDCKIWDGEEIGSNTSSYSNFSNTSGYTPPVSKNTCPLNSHTSTTDITKCTCDIGYQSNPTKDACILAPVKTNDQLCRDSFGVNAGWDGTTVSSGSPNCICQSGYVWNTGRTSCDFDIRAILLPGCSSTAGYSATTGISCDGANKCSNGTQLDATKTKCVSPTVVQPKKTESKTSIITPVKKNIKKVDTIKVEPKIEVPPIIQTQPAPKLKWYQKIFNWFK
ncbi:MAG: hypothetical protein NT094_01240 [Candidatus Staskawiczbacteria bacterium]|nr:hypothetical protein [Candidatus Staskawiczbacteria bacterium]